MCGRVRLPEDVLEITNGFGVQRNLFDSYSPKWNVAPTTQVPVIIRDNGERVLKPMRWWFTPAWSETLKTPYATFNCRADTLLKPKSVFHPAWKAGRRCLIATSGFYEWRKSDKQPFAVALGNRQPMMMAGLWERWKPRDGGRSRRYLHDHHDRGEPLHAARP
jgi:putative SOS response-associated peptidase YedK